MKLPHNIKEYNNNLFENWLNKNIHRFNYKPVGISKNRYYFEGIIKNIELIYEPSYTELALNFYNCKDEMYDQYVIDYVLIPQYDEKLGWYDNDLVEHDEDDYYKTYDELVIKSVFEKLITYTNTIFIDKNALYYINHFAGVTEGFISSKNSNTKNETNTKVYSLFS